MTETDIADVEHATGVRLPSAYRSILQNFPAFLLSQADADGLSEPSELFATKPSLILANNQDDLACFPNDCFIIGEDGCGDLYAISTALPDAPVFIGGPHLGEYPIDESGNRIPSYKSVYAYVASLHGEADAYGSGTPGSIVGMLGALLLLPVIVIGSTLAALMAPFVILLLWSKRLFRRGARTKL